MENLNADNYILKIAKTLEYDAQTESNSVFNPPAETGIWAMISRQHFGDENGKTKCTFGRLEIPDKLENVKISLGCARLITVKESQSDVVCNPGEIIVARAHSGDENGKTKYSLRQVYAQFGDSPIKYPCVTMSTEHVEVKESSGTTAEAEGKCIVRRSHFGDENAKTDYTLGKIAIPCI